MGAVALSCHLITPFLVNDETSLQLLDVDEEVEIQLGNAELDKGFLKRLLSQAQLMSELYTVGTTTVDFPEHRRSVTEFKGGYKIAVNRGASINEIRVFNLFFRIKSGRINSMDHLPVAQMYTTKDGERLIILYPDDTNSRIDCEKTFYLNKTLQLVKQGKVKQAVFNELIENMNLLNIHERCAQSLIHEYGHVLHWSSFDTIFSANEVGNTYPEQVSSSPLMNALILSWFEKHNYIYNVADRIPRFKTYDTLKKIHLLKEAFVEDYRIGLNKQSLNGKFILPNTYCVAGDLINPDLCDEGVRIVKNMLHDTANRDNYNIGTADKAMGHDMEHDRTLISSLFLDNAIDTDWVPGKDPFSKNDFDNMSNDLIKKSIRMSGGAILEAAATTTEEDISLIKKIEDEKSK